MKNIICMEKINLQIHKIIIRLLYKIPILIYPDKYF